MTNVYTKSYSQSRHEYYTNALDSFALVEVFCETPNRPTRSFPTPISITSSLNVVTLILVSSLLCFGLPHSVLCALRSALGSTLPRMEAWYSASSVQPCCLPRAFLQHVYKDEQGCSVQLSTLSTSGCYSGAHFVKHNPSISHVQIGTCTVANHGRDHWKHILL